MLAEQILDDVLVAANHRNEEVLSKAFGVKAPRAIGNFKCFRLPMYLPLKRGLAPVGLSVKAELNPAGCTVDNCACQECEWGRIDPWDIGVKRDECDLHHRIDCRSCA